VTGFDVDALLDEFADRVADRLAVTDRSTVEPERWRLLTVREAAERLGRSERWVRQRVKSGDLATVRLDRGALAFDVDDLRVFAAERRVGGRALSWRD
jgi:excisionase family DNA binding protein